MHVGTERGRRAGTEMAQEAITEMAQRQCHRARKVVDMAMDEVQRHGRLRVGRADYPAQRMDGVEALLHGE
jgi:hypothetical protein